MMPKREYHPKKKKKNHNLCPFLLVSVSFGPFLLTSVIDKLLRKNGYNYDFRYFRYDLICPTYDRNNIASIVFHIVVAQPGVLS